MGKVQEAVDCFEGGAACSQAILATYGEDLGLPRGQAMRLASGFAGGMRTGGTCGAVTGAIMVLGFRHAKADCDRLGSREKVYNAVRQFTSRFEERNKTVLCKELLGCDISTHEGMEAAIEKSLFREICPKLVRDAAEILEEML
jgi:C_GCAxxG_C_C family probable redox protein